MPWQFLPVPGMTNEVGSPELFDLQAELIEPFGVGNGLRLDDGKAIISVSKTINLDRKLAIGETALTDGLWLRVSLSMQPADGFFCPSMPLDPSPALE